MPIVLFRVLFVLSFALEAVIINVVAAYAPAFLLPVSIFAPFIFIVGLGVASFYLKR